jgi:hypothetical protein
MSLPRDADDSVDAHGIAYAYHVYGPNGLEHLGRYAQLYDARPVADVPKADLIL